MSEEKVVVETVGDVAVVYLGKPEERIVSLTETRLDSLSDLADKLKTEKPRGLVIAPPRENMFTVGADINAIGGIKTAEAGAEAAKKGQDIFSKIERLPFPVVAAISGPCLGGGCELALACTHRILSTDDSTRIGLPEVKLGILPGFGGTQRLPRLIGLPEALKIILPGKILRPKQALNAGVVDKLVEFEDLLEHAVGAITRDRPLKKKGMSLPAKFLTFTSVGRNFVVKQAEKNVRKTTKGFYPAPPAALRSILNGLKNGLAEGYKYEATECGKLLVTPECKSLIKLFFLTEAAKGIGKSAKDEVEDIRALVIGAGVMGAGIAGLLAKNGCSVILKDTDEAALERAKNQIAESLERLKYLSSADRSFILNRIETTTRNSPNMGSVNVLIEAIVENMEIKKKVLRQATEAMPVDSLITSNTSSLSITELATVINRQERVLGMHFFNPVDKMPLLEIIQGENTSDKAIILTAALATKLGKHPIVVRDVPGFLINRILTPYLNEAAYLFEEGYKVQDIDRAATRFGMPMGPLRLLDEVGLDIATHAGATMLEGYGERMQGPPVVQALLDKGRKGKKGKGGFYNYSGKASSPAPDIRSLTSTSSDEKSVDDLKPLQDRLILALLNEAVRCLDEGVAGEPGEDAAKQIDLGTVMGMGFPPFRGGLIHYADTIGAKKILSSLKKLHQAHGVRFEPASGIQKRAKSKGSFYA